MQSNPGTEKIDTIKFHDSIAGSYDEMLERSIVASNVRKKVHTKLLQYFKPGDHILDLNCGTGTDAIFLAKNGIYVKATDISPGMIEITQSKIKLEKLDKYIEASIMDSENLSALNKYDKFNGVLSNFNGINYLNDLNRFSEHLVTFLKPNSKLLFIVLNKICLYEVLYYAFKLKISLAYNKTTAREKTLTTRMYLYSPKTLGKIFSNNFTVKKITGFGILLPPDQLRNLYKRHGRVLSKIEKVEEMISSSFPFYNISDQYLIEMERK